MLHASRFASLPVGLGESEQLKIGERPVRRFHDDGIRRGDYRQQSNRFNLKCFHLLRSRSWCNAIFGSLKSSLLQILLRGSVWHGEVLSKKRVRETEELDTCTFKGSDEDRKDRQFISILA